MNVKNAAAVTLGFGIVLILLAIGFYIPTGEKTALIPAGIGLPIAICGLLAFKDKLRMHAVHVSLVFALLGVLGTLGMLPRIISGAAKPAAAIETVTMGVLCVIFIALGVMSFVKARQARKAEAAAAGSPEGESHDD